MGFNTSDTGGLRPFTADEIRAMQLQTTGVKDGSHPTIMQDFRACTVHRDWFCKWDQLDNAICVLLGGAASYTGPSGDAISRVMPSFMPGRPNYLAMGIERITGARSAGRDDANTVPAYKSAKLTVRYELVTFKQAADDAGLPEYARYVEILPGTTETSYLTVPGSMMKFRTSSAAPPDGTPIPYPIGRPESTTKIGRKWHRVPRSVWQPGTNLFKRIHGNPTTGERGFIGTVNKTPLFGYPSGTLLFLGVDEEVIPDPTVSIPGGLGDFAFNLTFWWSAKTTGGGLMGNEGFGHNYLYYPATFGSADLSGYYLATKLNNWVANGSIPDGKCLFDEREHADLYSVSA